MKFRLKIWRDEYLYDTNDTSFDPITIDNIKYLFNQFNIRLKNDDINHYGSFYVIEMNTTTGIKKRNFIRLGCKLNSFISTERLNNPHHALYVRTRLDTQRFYQSSIIDYRGFTTEICDASNNYTQRVYSLPITKKHERYSALSNMVNYLPISNYMSVISTSICILRLIDHIKEKKTQLNRN